MRSSSPKLRTSPTSLYLNPDHSEASFASKGENLGTWTALAAASSAAILACFGVKFLLN